VPLNWTLRPTTRGAQGAKAIHHAVGISRQRNSGYRPSRGNISWHKVSLLPSLGPHTHLSKKGRSHNSYTHQASLMVSCYTTLVASLALCLWSRPQHWHAKGVCTAPYKKERKKLANHCVARRLHLIEKYCNQCEDNHCGSIQLTRHFLKDTNIISHHIISTSNRRHHYCIHYAYQRENWK